jgi:hypothetical protein
MKSTEDFWSRKKFDPSGGASTGEDRQVDNWLLGRQRLGETKFISGFLLN